ncbi:MAG: hypothetical protein Q8L14_07925 [Myxococcales bacterium]|nr:hypothetical protein [Myxococcales bacterium]
MGTKILPRYNSATSANVSATTKPRSKAPKDVNLQVTVNDAALRREGHQFDGMEQAFALVPTRNKKNQIEWKRVELSFTHRSADRGGNMYDTHVAKIQGKGIRTDDLKNLGVAYGLKTNTGEVWLQHSDDNYKLPNR